MRCLHCPPHLCRLSSNLLPHGSTPTYDGALLLHTWLHHDMFVKAIPSCHQKLQAALEPCISQDKGEEC